jgi:hypothetical protein
MNADDRAFGVAPIAPLPNIGDFGMDTISLAGTLPAQLAAVRDAGFSQIMLSARDVVSHAEGFDDAVRAVRRSGLRVTGFQVLRDFEGLSGHLRIQDRHREIDARDVAPRYFWSARDVDTRRRRPMRWRRIPQARFAGDTPRDQCRLRRPFLGPFGQRGYRRLGYRLPRQAPNLGLAPDSYIRDRRRWTIDLLLPERYFWCSWRISCA